MHINKDTSISITSQNMLPPCVTMKTTELFCILEGSTAVTQMYFTQRKFSTFASDEECSSVLLRG